MLKPEEIKCEDVVSEISHTQSSATLLTNTSPKHTHDEVIFSTSLINYNIVLVAKQILKV